MNRAICFLHSSPAAIPPLMTFYKDAAPDLEITNLLDDGLLRFFRTADTAAAERRRGEMLATARDVYHVGAIMVTCSALSMHLVAALQADAGIPILKIDVPMAQKAVAAGSSIGVAVTFPPTIEPTRQLLLDAAAEAGKPIEVTVGVAAEAYQALLAGDAGMHDRLLLETIEALAEKGVESVVLAQVSMAGVLGKAKMLVDIPVYSSLETSLPALRKLLERTN
jgi:Asp/Glu/hydantoin racemase